MFEGLGLIALLIFWLLWQLYTRSTIDDGAPFVPLAPEIVNRVVCLAEIKNGEVFYDLGSGDGRIVIAAALKGARAYGIEVSLLKVWYSRLWLFFLGLSKNAKIIHKNIFETDLSSANIISLYLLQETNDKLQEKLEKELKPGTKVISIAFDFPGWKPIKIDPNGPVYGPIYIYHR